MTFKQFLGKIFGSPTPDAPNTFNTHSPEGVKVKVVDHSPLGGASFNLLLGFDVEIDPKTRQIQVFVNKQILTSEGERARTILNNLPSEELKFIVADLCTAACRHVLAHGDKVHRSEVQVPTLLPPGGPDLPN